MNLINHIKKRKKTMVETKKKKVDNKKVNKELLRGLPLYKVLHVSP